MSVMNGRVDQSGVSRSTEGNQKEVRMMRDGTISVNDFKFMSIMEGAGYMVTVGAFSTGIVGGGAGTILDADQPEFVISVPTNYSIIPLRIAAQVQTGAPTDAQELEILLAVDQDAAWDTTGTATPETIYNMNTLKGSASNCSARSAFTANITTVPVLDLELARKVVEYDVAANGEVGIACDLVYEPVAPLIINGPAMIVGYWGGDTATVGGFAQVQWIELPTTAFTI